MATPESRDAAVALHRQNINLRSVTRNDPSAVEILETSAYSTIYHYEDPEWEKQKMEGPTFIIRRDKQPFYAIYMLNRQTVKNVTIPLIPGEIKVTVVKEDMLQVARRGEKVKRAMWFSEGQDGVDRFRSKILEICGEPSKIVSHGTPLPATPASVSIATPSPAPGLPSDNGFSRLFAGLMPGSSQTPAPISGLAGNTSSQSQPADVTNLSQSEEIFPEAPILDNREASIPQVETTPSTGQTADDLLMSILGMAPPPRPAATTSAAPAFPSAPPRAQTPQTQASAPPASQIFNGSPSFAPPIPDPPLQHSPLPAHVTPGSQLPRRGSPMSPPPIPTESKPTHITGPPQLGEHDFPALGKTPSRTKQSGSPAAFSHITQPRSPIQHRYPDTLRQEPNPHAAFNHARSVAAPDQIPNGHQLPLVDAGIRAVALTMAKQGLGGVATNEEGKHLFMDTLLRRIHTEPAFVDELWGEFLRLTKGAIS